MQVWDNFRDKRAGERFEMASQESVRQLESRYCRFREYLNAPDAQRR